jgi:hypothetical protein
VLRVYKITFTSVTLHSFREEVKPVVFQWGFAVSGPVIALSRDAIE